MKGYLQIAILASTLIFDSIPQSNSAFKKVDYALPDSYCRSNQIDYKQIEKDQKLMGFPFEKDLVYIVIDSLIDKAHFTNRIWGENGYLLANVFFQEKLANDLKDDFGRLGYTIAFCTEDEAVQNNIQADWRLSLNISDLYSYASDVSSVNIPVANQTLASNTVHSTDNSFGAVSYQPIYYNDNTQFQYYTATSAEVNMVLRLNLKNDLSGKNIRDKIKSKYGGVKRSETDYVIHSIYQNSSLAVGDSSMNSLSDIAVHVLNGLYKKAYSDIKDNIEKAVN